MTSCRPVPPPATRAQLAPPLGPGPWHCSTTATGLPKPGAGFAACHETRPSSRYWRPSHAVALQRLSGGYAAARQGGVVFLVPSAGRDERLGRIRGLRAWQPSVARPGILARPRLETRRKDNCFAARGWQSLLWRGCYCYVSSVPVLGNLTVLPWGEIIPSL